MPPCTQPSSAPDCQGWWSVLVPLGPELRALTELVTVLLVDFDSSSRCPSFPSPSAVPSLFLSMCPALCPAPSTASLKPHKLNNRKKTPRSWEIT